MRRADLIDAARRTAADESVGNKPFNGLMLRIANRPEMQRAAARRTINAARRIVYEIVAVRKSWEY
jgi:hypothetical protein